MGSSFISFIWTQQMLEVDLDMQDFLCGSVGQESACNAGYLGSISGSGRSPGEGNGNPLQYFCLENPMDRGTWWATIHRVVKSWTGLSDWHFHFLFRYKELFSMGLRALFLYVLVIWDFPETLDQFALILLLLIALL